MTLENSPEDLREKVDFLKQAPSYPEAVTRVESIETHMSWVFLTDQYVYKLKKPVKYHFLDFSTLALRYNNCQEEIRLNMRLAPHIYEGILPLTRKPDGSLELGGWGKIIDWLVKMRRLPAERMLVWLIHHKQVTPEDVRLLAEVLCDFYKNAHPVPIDEAVYIQHLYHQVDDTCHELLTHDLSRKQLTRIHKWQLKILHQNTGLFENRARQGKIVEGHGDLRPEHIFLNHPPVIIDCLEFNSAFRLLDIAEELSFLAMECTLLQARWIGERIIEYYKNALKDDIPEVLIRFYQSLKACLRATLAIRHLHEPYYNHEEKWIRQARQYLQLAESYQ